MHEGRVPGQCDVPVAWPAGNILVSRPADERGFKAEFGYDDRKGFSPCDRDPRLWGLGYACGKSGRTAFTLSCAAGLGTDACDCYIGAGMSQMLGQAFRAFGIFVSVLSKASVPGPETEHQAVSYSYCYI